MPQSCISVIENALRDRSG